MTDAFVIHAILLTYRDIWNSYKFSKSSNQTTPFYFFKSNTVLSLLAKCLIHFSHDEKKRIRHLASKDDTVLYVLISTKIQLNPNFCMSLYR